MSTADPEATARLESGVVRASLDRDRDVQFAPGTMVAGRYRIASILGAGGMGEVYRADDTKLGQTVALKFLPPRLERDPILLARLHDEVRLGRQIAHPNVCHIYDIVEWDGAHFVAMEYVDGEDLARLLRRIGRLASDKAVDIARGIAAGLAAAHAKGILHRDLKPANIMIDSRGDARIMDFGLALAAGQDDGTISGTPAYMAPEQFEGRPATVQSDLYSLGLVMYELFTGRRAHNARTMPERIRELTSEIATPSSHIRDIDPRVERIILRCLSSDPAQRPASAREVIQALPGGDPLAAAMAAGETPSPRVVAAAGTEGSLKAALAWTLLGVTLALLATLLIFSFRTGYWSRSGLTRPPDVQADRAAEMLRRLGLPPQRFSVYGYTKDLSHEAWLLLHAPHRTRQLGRGFAVLRFWMREEPAPLFDSGFGRNPKPTFEDPPQSAPGSIAVETDPRGRLLHLRVLTTSGITTRPLRWPELLQAAGLDPATLRPAAPDFTPPSFADVRAAWTGTYPEDGTPIAVEAAAYRGVPVYFRIRAPWDARDFRAELPFGTPMFTFTVMAWLVAAVVVAIFFAWRNLRARRGDRLGAFRVAAAIFVTAFLSHFGIAAHAPHVAHEVHVVSSSLAHALLYAGAFWLVYIAIEPFIRRRWPQGLISWARLLAGNWRDPMVGRDVLIGLAVGTVQVALAAFSDNIRQLVQGQMTVAGASGDVRSLDALLHPLAVIAGGLRGGITYGLSMAVGVMVFLTLVRRRAAVAAAIFTGYVAVFTAASTDPVMIAMFVVIGALHTFTLLRFGVLATAAAGMAFAVTFFHPLPDALAWYTLRALMPPLLIVALAFWAFRTSLGGQRVFAADE